MRSDSWEGVKNYEKFTGQPLYHRTGTQGIWMYRDEFSL